MSCFTHCFVGITQEKNCTTYRFILVICVEAKKYTISTTAMYFAPIQVLEDESWRVVCESFVFLTRVFSCWTDNNYLCLAQKKGVHVYCFENQAFNKYKVDSVSKQITNESCSNITNVYIVIQHTITCMSQWPSSREYRRCQCPSNFAPYCAVAKARAVSGLGLE